MNSYSTYEYKGPVLSFGKLLIDNWSAKTSAVSKEKAESNLKYQAKKACNLYSASQIELPGKIQMTS